MTVLNLDAAEVSYLARLVRMDLASKERRYARPDLARRRAEYFARPENADRGDIDLYKIEATRALLARLDRADDRRRRQRISRGPTAADYREAQEFLADHRNFADGADELLTAAERIIDLYEARHGRAEGSTA